jgi:phage-related protein
MPRKSKYRGTPKRPLLDCDFYATPAGDRPVLSWLRDFNKRGDTETADAIGGGIEAVQRRWPLGMPLVEKFGGKLFAVRCSSATGEWRVFFTVVEKMIILLHGFQKRSRKTPQHEIEIARERLKEVLKR